MSAAPLAASSSSDSHDPARQREGDREHAEQRPRRAGTCGPARRGGGRSASKPDISTAPIGRAPRAARPGPCGPTCRISSAKIGRIATAPPNSTASRSSVIAPRKIGPREEKRQPRAHAGDQRLGPRRAAGGRGGADAGHGHQRRRHQRRGDGVRRASARPRRRSSPPSAGPVTAATCQIPVRQATALGNSGARHQLGAQRVARRQQKAARRAADDDDRVDGARIQRARAAAAAAEEQRGSPPPARRAQSEQHTSAHQRDPPPIAHVGDVPGVEREADERRRLGQPHHPQRQRIARDVVHLPGDDHPLDLGAHRHGQDAGDEPAEIRQYGGGVGIVRADRDGGGRR